MTSPVTSDSFTEGNVAEDKLLAAATSDFVLTKETPFPAVDLAAVAEEKLSLSSPVKFEIMLEALLGGAMRGGGRGHTMRAGLFLRAGIRAFRNAVRQSAED